MIAIDFGEGNKLRLRNANGMMEPPAKPRGASGAEYFPFVVNWCLDQDDTVVESATIGSSGAEPDAFLRLMAQPHGGHILFVLPTRAVKNSLGRTPESDDEAVDTIYDLATSGVTHLRVYRAAEKFVRLYKSVRPWDKRNYKGSLVDDMMSRLVSPDLLSEDARRLFAVLKSPVRNPHWEYVRAATLPLAMALTESIADTRDGYEKVIGLYAHGYPSFYRRATVTLMQKRAKEIAGVTTNKETTPEQRKEAWRQVRRAIRELYGKSTQGIINPTEGTV